MATVIYNCKRCKTAKRVEYPLQPRKDCFYRQDAAGQQIPSGVWIDSIGGGKPTVYGGDPLGVCAGCNRMMSYGQLKATVRAEVRCDARCTGARGPSCDCSCGGKNHGSGWLTSMLVAA